MLFRSVQFKDGDGTWRVYVKDADASGVRSYSRPLYYDYTLTKNLSSGVFTLTQTAGLRTYTFDSSGKLTGLADRNGKPVDVLEIPGNISDGDAKKLEELIWSRLPEAQELRANVGKFTDEKNASKISHPLALTQLLIAYHMVKAQVGVHAI